MTTNLLGRPAPPPMPNPRLSPTSPTVSCPVKLTAEMLRRFDARAAAEHRPRSELMREAFELWLGVPAMT